MKTFQVAFALLLLPSSTAAGRRGGPRTKATEERHRVRGPRGEAARESEGPRGEMSVPHERAKVAEKEDAERAAVSAHRTKVESDSELGEDNGASYGNSCVDDPPVWHDSDGPRYNCDWYAQGNRCIDFGGKYANFGKTADQACCACGGGGSCVDDPPHWHDSGGYNCNWYGGYDSESRDRWVDPFGSTDRCSMDGDDYENFGKTANEACCFCGGGLGYRSPPGTVVCDGQPPENYCDCGGDCNNEPEWCACMEAQECCGDASNMGNWPADGGKAGVE